MENSSSILREGGTFSDNDLKYLQSMPLEIKVARTQAKILQWCQYWDWQVYVSFSGGKDSTVLFDLVTRVASAFNRNVPAVFCDTGLEYPEIRDFVRSFGERVIWVRPEISFRKVIEDFGYPVISKDVALAVEYYELWPCMKRRMDSLGSNGEFSLYNSKRYGKFRYLLDAPFKISAKCCDYLKVNPLRNFERQTKRRRIVTLLACESKRRKTNFLRGGCNVFDSRNPVSNPMGFWTEQDVLEYLRLFQVPFCSVYGEIIGGIQKDLFSDECYRGLSLSGCQRTGCMFCMFGCHLEKGENRFQRMKRTHPRQYDYCVNRLGCGKVLDFLRVDY